MTFASPTWLWALLLLLPLFALRIVSHMTSRKSLSGLVAPRLRDTLVRNSSQVRHWLSFIFVAFGLAMIVIAMARPQWGFEEVESFSEGRSLILAIDTSRSMLASDLVPNRLERAKLAARDIVDGLGEDQIGLIAFAGRAFMQAPLTTDHQSVIESIEQVDTDIIPRGGTNLTAAASLALSSFRETDAEQNAMIIFSDGEAMEGQEQVNEIKQRAKQENMVIITVGVGTEAGSIIPEPGRDGRPQEGVFIKDANGQVVRSRLDSSALRELATGGGTYLQLGDRGSVLDVVKTITANLAATKKEDVARQRPIERFMWPLSAGLVFFLFSQLIHLLFAFSPKIHRTSQVPLAAKATILFLLLFPGNSMARDGWKHIRNRDYETALKQFEITLNRNDLSRRELTGIQLGIGSAAYKLGDYELATKAYGKALIKSGKSAREQAHYNLGNTLFRKGEATLNPPGGDPLAPQGMAAPPEKIAATLQQWFGALEHYQAALNLNENNDDARHNIEVIKKRIELLKQEQENQPEQPQQQQQQDQQEENGEQPQENQPNQSEDQGENKKEEGDQPQDPQNNESDENSDSQEPENNEPEEPSDEGQSEQNQSGNESETQPPDPGEGELTADEPQNAQKPEPRNREVSKNPDTGYSPSEARQLIEALADENGELKPVYPRPFRSEKYKNW